MFRTSVQAPASSFVDEFRRYAQERFERAALRTVAQVARLGKTSIRNDMQGAGLGRLGLAIGSNSDADTGFVKRYGGEQFSVSAAFFVRSRSERTLGAIASYTQGAEIRPVRSRYLWIATDEIPRVTGRYRMTPELYRKNGFEQKIGPLVMIRSVNGGPLLIVKNASVNMAGKSRSAKALTKTGKLRKGQRAKEFIVAFVGIPRTARQARVNITAILDSIRAELPAIFASELEKDR